ncbi:unnamed protein product [Pleuronectes platessa]|uniref:Uncharacterized protein n=1 Tax=Pleuronectes platessa TaxID=8262 RepID=A0A9N7UZT1_PLEPL|nr:unnamed protein product [Pleuronectes platessa]
MCPLQGNRTYLPQNKQMMLFLKEEMGRLAHTPPAVMSQVFPHPLGLGSTLAPEILLSPSCCSEVEEDDPHHHLTPSREGTVSLGNPPVHHHPYPLTLTYSPLLEVQGWLHCLASSTLSLTTSSASTPPTPTTRDAV